MAVLRMANPGSGWHRPCTSLPALLTAVAETHGYRVGSDELLAAMGLSLMVPAVEDTPDLGEWMFFARDAFLIPAAGAFGMTIREVHPPRAALGLRDSAEFRQHFDASYRPFIVRALEHGQPVLAWQGWSGSASMLWGKITSSCQEGAGFRGVLYLDSGTVGDVLLEAPAVQVYVVESIHPRVPSPENLLELVLLHAADVFNDQLRDRFAVRTGPQAYTTWIERLKQFASTESDSAHETLWRGHQALRACVNTGCTSLARFLQERASDVQTSRRAETEALSRWCQEVTDAIGGPYEVAAAQDVDAAIVAIKRVLRATEEVRDVITPIS